MCDPVSAVVSAVAGQAIGSIFAKQAAKPADNAANQAKMNADQLARDAEKANSKAEAKSPNVQNLIDENAQAALSGNQSTMLTGPGGVDPSSLILGKNTLLGQ